jgi:hypothetical protein
MARPETIVLMYLFPAKRGDSGWSLLVSSQPSDELSIDPAPGGTRD